MTKILHRKAFKAFSRKNKKIYDVTAMSLNALGAGDWLVFGKDEQIGVEGLDCDLLRSIGKNDRTGREIYEGYILKYILPPEHGPDVSPDIYVVEWVEYGFEARWANPPTPRARSDGHLSLQDVERDMEIIGNIYENPELLKDYAKLRRDK